MKTLTHKAEYKTEFIEDHKFDKTKFYGSIWNKDKLILIGRNMEFSSCSWHRKDLSLCAIGVDTPKAMFTNVEDNLYIFDTLKELTDWVVS